MAIVGGLCLAAASNRIWALRNLAAEIDRFGQENERLEGTQARLNGEVQFLSKKKDDLTGNVTRLEGTVGNLQNVSEGLQNELEQFQKLKGDASSSSHASGVVFKATLKSLRQRQEKTSRRFWEKPTRYMPRCVFFGSYNVLRLVLDGKDDESERAGIAGKDRTRR